MFLRLQLAIAHNMEQSHIITSAAASLSQSWLMIMLIAISNDLKDESNNEAWFHLTQGLFLQGSILHMVYF